jgi:hypothetical protein
MEAREWARASLAALRANPRTRWMRPATRILPLIVPVPFFVAVLLRAGTGAEVLNAAVPWEVVALMPLFALEFWSRVGTRMLLRRFGGRNEERAISEAGLDVAGMWDATFVPWSEMRWVAESGEFLFFRSYRETYFVPTRLLSDSALERIRGLVRAHCSDPIRLLPGARRAT